MKLCPICDNTKLATKMIGEVELDECSSCHGLWFERDELRQAKDGKDDDLSWLDFDIWRHEEQFKQGERALSCPTCRAAMVNLGYGETGVSIDCCSA